jgi:nucleoside-diphosphate-sugar epimerase
VIAPLYQQKQITMKIVLTGSIGNISKPLAQQLIAKGHDVTVISSKAERQKDIEALGAKAAIGNMEDAAFLTKAFTGADIVYCMETTDRSAMTDPNYTLDVLIERIKKVVNNYKHAIMQAGVKKVVHLSSIGAHRDNGVGLLKFHYYAEKIMNELPADVSVKFMRPVGFYYNLLDNAPLIKTLSKGFVGAIMALQHYGIGGLLSGKRGVIVANYGGDTMNLMVSPLDIASTIAEEMEKPFAGRTIRYIASEEITCSQTATILGEAIGKPYLKWGVISDKQLLKALIGMKVTPSIAEGIVEMNASGRNGLMYEDYYRHRPALGKTKLTSYAPEFAKVYNQE